MDWDPSRYLLRVMCCVRISLYFSIFEFLLMDADVPSRRCIFADTMTGCISTLGHPPNLKCIAAKFCTEERFFDLPKNWRILYLHKMR